ncbi:MAG: alpha/beta hydrolase [Deltaproteobacteria bacterium]|nr:alpha/beta hydrolase [Deltaproteobacteria bacterium]
MAGGAIAKALAGDKGIRPISWTESMDERDLQTRGLRFRIREAGEGPLVLCMHGYPDTAHTWDDLLPRLADAGYHAVAPWMRGYPPTEIPANGDFSVPALGQDVLDLADALGAETCTLVGHDWGASTVYQATGMAPERVDKLVTVAIPPLRATTPSPALAWSFRHFVFYALPRLPERQLRANGWQGVRDICKRWSPSWTIPDDEFAHIVAAFEAPGGLRAALGYYRAFMGGQLGASGRAMRSIQGKRISVPTMLIYGDEDVAAPLFAGPKVDLGRCFTDGTPFEVVRITGGGHFVHREKIEETGDAVLRWLTG